MTHPREPGLAPVDELNGLPRDEFTAALRPLFERAEPLAAALYAARPFTSYADVVARAESLAASLDLHEQVQLVNSHARIGAAAAIVRGQSTLSYREQGYDQEAGLASEEVQRVYAELAELNRAYEVRFGFRFVIFVDQRPKSVIAERLRERLANTRADELQTALHELFAIARDRYQRLAMRARTPGSMQPMQHQSDNAARMAVLDELRRSALETYGEERTAESRLKTALEVAATAIWRVGEEPLDPLGNEPLPTHG